MRQEARARARVDRIGVNILALVTSNMGENPIHRKHTGFFATLVSGELGDPKPQANHHAAKGKHVNIHAHSA